MAADNGTVEAIEPRKKAVRTGDKDNEQVLIPKNRLVPVFIGLMLTVFLSALDQTIVCTSPTTHS
jgi:hypothetical protein